MAFFNKEIDITRNIKLVEWLKSELLTDVGNLFRVLVNGMSEELHDSIADIISNLILICYLLGKRLGISYNAIELKIRAKIKLGLVEDHEVERFYGDLSELSKHLDSSRAVERSNRGNPA